VINRLSGSASGKVEFLSYLFQPPVSRPGLNDGHLDFWDSCSLRIMRPNIERLTDYQYNPDSTCQTGAKGAQNHCWFHL